MADQENDENLDLDEEGLTEDGEPETDGSSGDESSEEATKPAEDKRVRDLQSAADKATARANKAEAALAKALSRGETSDEGSKDPEREALLSELRDASLDAVYAEFGELKTYGIDRALIGGRTRAEMRESATALVGLIKSVATKERNRVLKDNGIVPEPAGSTRTPPKNFAEMSDEEFEKFRAARRGSSLWR